jgi:phage-related minor tail protein
MTWKDKILAAKSTLKPTPAEDKIARTDKAARAIIGAEDQARREKTDRLREARLAKEAEQAAADDAPAAPATKPAAKKPRRIKV